jgi:hypothetical protein
VLTQQPARADAVALDELEDLPVSLGEVPFVLFHVSPQSGYQIS